MLILLAHFKFMQMILLSNILVKMKAKKNIITGVEWNELTEDEKDEYIVESMVKVIEKALDEAWDDITVSVKEDFPTID